MALSFLLLGCSSNVYDDYNRDGLLARIESNYASENYAQSREAAESFIARFPQDEQIDMIRLKLLASYIYSGKHALADAYADRLLEGVLLNDEYYEDVEYYKILNVIEKSKQWLAETLRLKSMLRNFSELGTLIDKIDAFMVQYPNSAYLQQMEVHRYEIRSVMAEHHLGVALHYAKKGNVDAMEQRLQVYYEQFADIETPLLAELLSYKAT